MKKPFAHHWVIETVIVYVFVYQIAWNDIVVCLVSVCATVRDIGEIWASLSVLIIFPLSLLHSRRIALRQIDACVCVRVNVRVCIYFCPKRLDVYEQLRQVNG